MEANYHTHTYRCNHAVGGEEEYIKAAIKAGIKELGFSDHCPWPVRHLEYMRMEMKELDGYLSSLIALKESYKHDISIKIGLECEYFADELEVLQSFHQHPAIDYLIFGNHFHLWERHEWYYGSCVHDEETLNLYAEDSIQGMESGLFTIFAHPDLCFREYPEFDESARKASYRICEKAKELGILLEYNLGGLRLYKHQIPHYPRYEFWKIVAEVGNAVVIGVDAHNPADLLDGETYDWARATLDELGITNLIHKVSEFR